MEQFTYMSDLPDMTVMSRYSDVMSSVPNRLSSDRDKGDDDRYIYLPFGKALRHYRERADLTQAQLAAILGHSGHSTVAGWEQRAEPLSSDLMMERLAGILNAPIDDLAAGRILRERAAIETFDQVIEREARTYLSGRSLELAMTIWKAAEVLGEENQTTVARIVEALAEQERAKRRDESQKE